MAVLMRKGKFAKLCHVSAMTITTACKKELEPALNSNQIDTAHPAAQSYMISCNVNPSTGSALDPSKDMGKPIGAPPKKRATGQVQTDPVHAAQTVDMDDPTQPQLRHRDDKTIQIRTPEGDVFENLFNCTLREIVDRFGSITGFGEYLSQEKRIEEIREKRLKNQKARGDLIERSFVQRHIFAHLEAAHHRLLNDSPMTITNRIIDEFEAGESKEDIIEICRSLIEDQLKGLKHKASEALKNADLD